MTHTQSNQYRMGGVVLGVLDKHNSVWSGNSVAVAKRNLLKDVLDKLGKANGRQMQSKGRGLRDEKLARKLEMGRVAESIAMGVCAYAIDVHNPELVAQFERSAWDVFKMKDIECVGFCRGLYEFADANVGLLGDYNINSTVLGQLQDAIYGFRAKQSAPRVKQGRLSAATRDIETGLKDMLKVLKWWDLFAGGLRVSQSNFYVTYRSARKVHKLGIRHVSVRGMVKAEGSGTPLYKVKVRAEGMTHKWRSGKHGNFALRSLNPGEYVLMFELRGYEAKRVENVSVRDGEITEVMVEMRGIAD